MNQFKNANLGLRFLLELCMLAAFAYWGYRTGMTALMSVLLAVAAPAAAATVWGILLAPRAPWRLRNPWLQILEIVLFSLAVAALCVAVKVYLGIAFGLVYALNKTLILVWRQQDAGT